MFTNKLELQYCDELHNYDIFPKVVPAGKVSEVCIKPLGRHAAFLQTTYQLKLNGLDEGDTWAYPDRPNDFQYEVAPDEDGCIRFSFEFFGEQQFFVRLFLEKSEENGLRSDFNLRLSMYAVAEDLVGRYPYRGDCHMHSFRSDGKQSPEVLAADYRKTGYDFMAVTDHLRYYPSLEAIAAYKDVKIDLTLVPGEEVHLPCDEDNSTHLNNVHIVNFGGSYSVNALVRDGIKEAVCHEDDKRAVIADPPPIQSTEAHWAEVDAYMETIDIPAQLKGSERYTFASCCWVFEHIKKGGGLGIFCHPYWISDVYQVPESLTDYILKTQPFDAFEVLGGENYYEQNGHQTVKYYEDRSMGRRYPIVGSTDSHSSVNNVNALIASTIVFSPANEREALIDSIKDFYSVAVDTISKEFRLVGDFRLTKYACFLLNNYFPIHDELCIEEGLMMKAYAAGYDGAKESLEFLSGRMQKLRERYFQF